MRAMWQSGNAGWPPVELRIHSQKRNVQQWLTQPHIAQEKQKKSSRPVSHSMLVKTKMLLMLLVEVLKCLESKCFLLIIF
jgi:hypothetical protein